MIVDVWAQCMTERIKAGPWLATLRGRGKEAHVQMQQCQQVTPEGRMFVEIQPGPRRSLRRARCATKRAPFPSMYATLAAILFTLWPAQVQATSVCPGHLLTVETDGRASAGSKAALKSAVMAGEPIRIGWTLDWNDDGKIDVTHWADAMFLTIFEDDVFTQTPAIHRQTPLPGRSDIELTAEPTLWSSSLGTNGLWRGRFSNSNQTVAFKVRSWWCRDPRGAPRLDR